jgi:hypothetical protein
MFIRINVLATYRLGRQPDAAPPASTGDAKKCQPVQTPTRTYEPTRTLNLA